MMLLVLVDDSTHVSGTVGHAQARLEKVTSPLDHDVSHGHLCVKGRFGFELVQRRAGES
jgi:predicted molibdopterin-dependent oxidoreductase YjgC